MFKIPVTLACLLLIAYALRLDRKESAGLSWALWIPAFWLMIVASRPVSFWFSSEGYAFGAEAIETGSPIDRTIFTILLVAALWCLVRRNLAWSELIRKNRWFVAFVVFAGVSILWSPYPFVSLKRWFRGLGAAAAALIVVTDKDQFAAIRAVFRRVAFVLIPLSVLFIRYYREIGISYGPWGGMMYTGVTTHKNILGRLSLLSIFYSILALTRKDGWGTPHYRQLIAVNLLCLFMSVYLMDRAKSATAFATCLIGIAFYFGLKALGPSIARINALTLVCLPIVFAFFYVLDFWPAILDYLERDETLTGRSDLWTVLIGLKSSVLVGIGYGGFWIGERLDYLWSLYWWAPTSAHNGYLEVFLQLGMVGLLLLLGCLTTAYRTVLIAIRRDFFEGRFYYSMFLVFLAYNVTESATSLNSMMWFIFTLVGLRPEAVVVGETSASSLPRSSTPSRISEIAPHSKRFVDSWQRTSDQTSPGFSRSAAMAEARFRTKKS